MHDKIISMTSSILFLAVLVHSSTMQELNLKQGYECSFREKLSSDVQTECSICLHIPREPYMVGCCGNRFCRDCIEPIRRTAGKCPLCNQVGLQTLPDKQLERLLNDKSVYCSFRDSGCDWVGKLKNFDEHYKECVFNCSVQCPYCNKPIPQHSTTQLHVKNCSLKCLTQAIADMAELKDEVDEQKYEIDELQRENLRLRIQLQLKDAQLSAQSEPAGTELTEYLSVTNLPDSVNESMLKSVFGQHGTQRGSVCSVTLTDNEELAVIEYQCAEDAKRALSHSKDYGINLKSCRLCVNPVYNV